MAMGSFIETPNPFSPRSDLVAFLERSESPRNRDLPDWQEAAARVRKMLAEMDAREAKAASAKKKPASQSPK